MDEKWHTPMSEAEFSKFWTRTSLILSLKWKQTWLPFRRSDIFQVTWGWFKQSKLAASGQNYPKKSGNIWCNILVKFSDWFRITWDIIINSSAHVAIDDRFVCTNILSFKEKVRQVVEITLICSIPMDVSFPPKFYISFRDGLRPVNKINRMLRIFRLLLNLVHRNYLS